MSGRNLCTILGPMVLAVACVCASVFPSTAAGVYASYADVRPVLDALGAILPVELADTTVAADAAWSRWALRHDEETRRRLQRGDEDTIVNWLLFGRSFTARPRPLLDREPSDPELVKVVAERTGDLIQALRSPGSDERRQFARQLLEQNGFPSETESDRNRLFQHLVGEVARVTREQTAFARELAELRRLGNPSQEFAARSRLFRSRGLSLDTSLLPGVALERSLAQLQSRGLIQPGSIREVAVIGPGLDFSDKSSGYDFYPPQTVQPFALIDSLVRLGIARKGESPLLTTLDLSPRVNDHLTQARQRADRGVPYVYRLALDPEVKWKPEVTTYWRSAGSGIGSVVGSTETGPDSRDVNVRTVTVPPEAMLGVRPEDVNIVVQRLAGRRFDLIVATNVFVYYDILDQALAAANVEAMLRPGGYLLSNNALLELPASRLRSEGYLTVEYSDRPDDGDHIVWYRRQPD
jgi:hypothetical protein